MNLYNLQNSTSNAGSNVKRGSGAKFFSLSKFINRLLHHTKRGGKHIKKHHKKYRGTFGTLSAVHLFFLKILGIKLLGIKALALILTSFGINHNLATLADFDIELVNSPQNIEQINYNTARSACDTGDVKTNECKKEEKLKTKILKELKNKNYKTGDQQNDISILIGTGDIDLSTSDGDLLIPVTLQSNNELSGNNAYVDLPEGLTLHEKQGGKYTGKLKSPEFKNPKDYNDTIGEIGISAMSVGGDKPIKLKNKNNEPLYATFTMPVPESNFGDLIDIYYSEDDINFQYMETTSVVNINNEPYVVFMADHFTVFVTTANNGTNIYVYKAANSSIGSGWTPLGPITITEGDKADFVKNQTAKSIILSLPSNWQFLSGSCIAEFVNIVDLTAGTYLADDTTLTMTLTTDAAASAGLDSVRRTGCQIQAIDGSILSTGNILRLSSNPGTFVFNGIVNNVTNFGTISQIPGAPRNLITTLSGETFLPVTGNIGTAIFQYINSEFIIPSITAVDQFKNITTSYSGNKTLSYTGPGGAPSYTTGVSFTNGQSTTTLNTTLTQLGSTTITATDGILTGITSSSFSVVGSGVPEILTVSLTPTLDLSYFGSYSFSSEIDNSTSVISGIVEFEGINGDGGNCTSYYASGSCLSTTDTQSLTYSGNNIREKSIVRPDNIYPQIGFADDSLYRYNIPEEILINKNNYSLLHFQNPFTMTGGMNFWVEFNAVPENLTTSRNLTIYLVESGHNISDFNTDRTNSSFVHEVGSYSRSAIFDHEHTINSTHHVIKLATNPDGTVTTSNLDVNGDFWILLYNDQTSNKNKGWNLRYQSGTMCDDYQGRYVGDLGNQTTSLQSGGCPDTHIHLARSSGIVDGVKSTTKVTYSDGPNTGEISSSSYSYFGAISNLAPNSTQFISPIVETSYSSDITIERQAATDPNNDTILYNIYLLSSTGETISTLVAGTSSTQYTLDISGLSDGQYSLQGKACDGEPLCTDFYLEDNFIVDNTKPTANIIYSETGLTNNDVLVTLTGFSETGITITNNNGSGLYTFTGNGSFTFEFEDVAGNTGETTATVTWIDKDLPILSWINDVAISSLNTETISVNYDSATIQKYKFIDNINDCDGTGTTTYTGAIVITNKDHNNKYFCAYAESLLGTPQTLVSTNKINLSIFIVNTGSTSITGTINTGGSYILQEDGILIISSGSINGSAEISGAYSIISSGCSWDGNFIPPTFVIPTAPEAADNTEIPNKDIKQSITVGANNCASLYLSGAGNSKYFNIEAEILNGSSGDNLEIFRSSDGTTWENNPIDSNCILDTNQICRFQTDHLTYFAFGSWTGSFTINNDSTYTSGLNVTLNIAVTGATDMRFGNSISERNSASWTGYSTTYPWTITTGDGVKTVYAEFSGGGISNTVEDSIILDTTKPTATIEYNPSTTTTESVTATLTGFSETGTTITNNGGSSDYIFTENGSFIFEFKDSAGNTGETTANVTWINRSIYFTGDTPSNGLSMSGQIVNIDIGIDIGIFTGFTRSRDGIDYDLYNDGLIFMSNLDNNSDIGDNSTTVIDISNNGNTGTVNGDTARTGNGKRNGAYTFDGAGDYIDLGTYSLTSYTISARFKDDIAVGRRTIIGDPGTSFEISRNGNEIEVFANGGLTSNNRTGDIGTRYHIAVVTDIAGTKLYIDGQLNTENTSTTSINSQLVIGNGYTSQYRDGLIDEVRIYNYGLSSGDIKQLYLSNLQKVNSGYWEFNTTQTGLADDTYIYTGSVYTGGEIYSTSRSVTIDQTPFNGITVSSTSPYSGEIDVFKNRDIIINFFSPMNTGTTAGNIIVNPPLSGVQYTRSGDQQLILYDYEFEYETTYTITIGTGLITSNSEIANEPYIFSFQSMPPEYLEYSSDTFSESVNNDGIISNTIIATLTGDTFSASVASGGNILIENMPTGLTGVFERLSDTQVSISLSGTASSHLNSDDISNLIIIFTGSAFNTLLPEHIFNDQYTLSVNFLDPYNVTLLTTKDTVLDGDLGYENNNHGADTNLYLNNLEQILLGFDLSNIPAGADIDSAKISLTMNGGTANPIISMREIYNNEWIEGIGTGNIALDGEPTFNQREYGTPGSDWYGGGPGLIEGTDYGTEDLLNTGILNRDTPTIIDINSTGLQTLEKRWNDSGTNYGFIITITGNDSIWSTYLASKENTTTAWRPSLEIFYTPDTTPPTATVEYNPGSGSNTPLDVTATLTGFSEENVIITNNGGYDTYVFTGNGSFTFEFEDGAGNTGESTAIVTWIDKTYPVIQSTDPTSGSNNVLTNKPIEIQFNSDMNTGSVESAISINPSLLGTGYTRSDDRTLLISHNLLDFDTTYTIQINTGAQNATGNNLQSPYIFSFNTIDVLSLSYSEEYFYESLDNDGTIRNSIVIQLSGDTFTNDAISGNYITFNNIPAGLTGVLSLDNATQITRTLSGAATNHTAADYTHGLSIYFDDGAFQNYSSGDINNSSKTDFHILTLDPYQQLQIIPIHDNILDADTEPLNGCDNGVCQEMNYGQTTYGGWSDFGSKLIMKFDLSSIAVGSHVYGADFRMTKMDLDTGTGFEIKQIINNPGWIEGSGDFSAAITGESNYKQRKRGEENWNNGNPGLVELSDYKADNVVVNPYFDTIGNETKTFDLNNTGINMLEEWINTPSSNEGFAIMNADKNWVYVRTSEYATVSERPLLTITYIPDQTAPHIDHYSPLDDAIDVSVTTNLSVTFNETIHIQTGYDIMIKKTADDSTVQTIDASNSAINIDGTELIVTINQNNLQGNTGYYILIDSGAFVDDAGNTFPGISNSTTWNFTTIDDANLPQVSTPYYTGLTSTSATMGGTIESTGSGNVTERGIYRSLTNGFGDGNGTKVSTNGSWSNTGAFTLPVSGFSSGTQIYFKAFAVNGYGTGYSETQGSFITKPGTPTITITETSNDQFRVNRDSIVGASSYNLYVSENIEFTSLITGYAPMTGLIGNTHVVHPVDIQTNYYVKLVAVNSGGNSTDSNIANTTTTFTPNPTVHLKFEESIGSIAYDSAFNHDGILEGSPLKLQTGAENYAYNFDGVNDALSIVDFNYGPELSLYFWIKQSSANDNEFVFSHGAETDPSSINVYFNDSNQQLITSINGNTGAVAITGSNYTGLLDNEWHLYVLTLDYSTVTGKILSKVYIDGSLAVSDSSIDAPGSYNPTTNIVLGRRGSNTAGTYYSGYIDDFRMYNQYLLAEEVEQLYLSTLDDVPPTATIEYSPGSGQQTTSNVTATLTGFSESGVVITNNLGSNTYVFTENGNFTFEFKDAAGNTGETTATVTWIVTGTLDIGVPTSFTFTGDIRSKDYNQEFTGQFTGTDYFFVEDQLGLDAGYYTTISATDLTGNTVNIGNENLYLKTNGIQKINGDDNSLVEINSILNNYTPLSGQVNYIFRNTATNSGKTGKYGDLPYLKINVPALTPADTYHGQIIFTLYEN